MTKLNAGSASDTTMSKLHAPRVAIIIPHYNHYSEFLADALFSVQEQTHENFSCIVVDDCSVDEHYQIAKSAVQSLGDERFRLIRAPENRGQIPSVFLGLKEVTADFTCILDPDDRYTPDFLTKMLSVHINARLMCPLASCDQYFVRLGDGIISGTSHNNQRDYSAEATEEEARTYAQYGFHRFVAPDVRGWHWTSTSAMMFRTDALRLIAPVKTLAYKGLADNYCAHGTHMMGGSLVLREPLVYRGIHSRNDFMNEVVFSIYHNPARPEFTDMENVAKIDVLEAFLKNGGLELFDPELVQGLIIAQFQGAEFIRLLRTVPQVAEIFGEPAIYGTQL